MCHIIFLARLAIGGSFFLAVFGRSRALESDSAHFVGEAQILDEGVGMVVARVARRDVRDVRQVEVVAHPRDTPCARRTKISVIARQISAHRHALYRGAAWLVVV